jgi:CspA family cold shock protein
MAAKIRGEVKTWNASRGFGFFRRDDGGKDVFVHITAVEKAGLTAPLLEGARYAFEVQDGDKGPKAANLQAI